MNGKDWCPTRARAGLAEAPTSQYGTDPPEGQHGRQSPLSSMGAGPNSGGDPHVPVRASRGKSGPVSTRCKAVRGRGSGMRKSRRTTQTISGRGLFCRSLTPSIRSSDETLRAVFDEQQTSHGSSVPPRSKSRIGSSRIALRGGVA